MTTTARGLILPTVGADVGVWGGYLNSDFSSIDKMFGQLLEVSVASGATLSTSDTQNTIIRLTGTLTGNVDVTFPHVAGWWYIDNRTTGNYYVRLKTSTATTATVGVPQGCITQVYIDTVSATVQGVKFAIDSRPGSVWQTTYATSPVWLNACTSNGSTAFLPWISCDGSEYSQTVYPYLYAVLGTTWKNTGGRADPSAGNFRVPDFQNSALVSVMPSAPWLTSTYGLAGNTVGAQGYNQSTLLSTAQLPVTSVSNSITITTQPTFSITTITGTVAAGGTSFFSPGGGAGSSSAGVTRITDVAGSFTASFGSGDAHTNVQPTSVHGMTFIKT